MTGFFHSMNFRFTHAAAFIKSAFHCTRCTIGCLYINQLIDIWVVSTFCCLWIKPGLTSWLYNLRSSRMPAITRAPMPGLVLCYHCLEILKNFIFELVFRKWNLMGQRSMDLSKGDTCNMSICHPLLPHHI